MPAAADGTMEVGNGGWGNGPKLLKGLKSTSARIMNKPMATPTIASTKNLCLLETFGSQISGKPSFCESFNPRKPKPPYKISTMATFTRASTGFEAGSFCDGRKVS